MNSASQFIKSTMLSVSLLVAAGSRLGAGEPFVPKDGSQVLERIKRSPFESGVKARPAKREQEPRSLPESLAAARELIARAKRESDPRYLGRAQAVLTPWRTNASPAAEVLVLWAVMEQSNHRFDAALAELGRALALEPGNAQAWLSRTAILQVRGEYAEARKAAMNLFRLTSPLVAVTAAAGVGGLTGEGERSCELLGQTLRKATNAPVAEKVWALTALAETQDRLGRSWEAEESYQAALALDSGDIYLLAAYADHLMDEGKFKEVEVLLEHRAEVDGLLLRLLEAQRPMNPVTEGYHQRLKALEERFAANRLRGDNAHAREEARYRLHLADDPAGALRLAVENWKNQREPADARILLEAALAQRKPEAAEAVISFIETNKVSDQHLTGLVERLKRFSPSADVR